MGSRNWKDVVGGSIAAALGGAFALGATSYEIGAARQMGPGFFPLVVGMIICALSIIVILQGLRRPGILPSVAWRPLLAVILAGSLFMLFLPRFGLAPAILILVAISALGDQRSSVAETVVLACIVCVLVVGVFVIGLGVSVSIFRRPW